MQALKDLPKFNRPYGTKEGSSSYNSTFKTQLSRNLHLSRSYD